jgi:hypothetical protein
MGHWASIKDYYEFSNQELSDLLTTAFEGGINYWCKKVEIDLPPLNAPKDFYLSDVISYGGTLKLIDEDEDGESEFLILTAEKMIAGIEQYCKLNAVNLKDLLDYHDAESADQIVQYALFNELIYG